MWSDWYTTQRPLVTQHVSLWPDLWTMIPLNSSKLRDKCANLEGIDNTGSVGTCGMHYVPLRTFNCDIPHFYIFSILSVEAILFHHFFYICVYQVLHTLCALMGQFFDSWQFLVRWDSHVWEASSVTLFVTVMTAVMNKTVVSDRTLFLSQFWWLMNCASHACPEETFPWLADALNVLARPIAYVWYTIVIN